jgi:hypothetical protein
MASFRKSKKDQPPEDPTCLPRSLELSKTTFFGASLVPAEVKASIPLLHALPPDALRPLLQQITALLKGTVRDITDEQFMNSQRKMLLKLAGLNLDTPFDGASYGTLFSGLYTLLRVAVRTKTPGDVLRADLLRMHVPATATEALLRVVHATRPDIEVESCLTLCHYNPSPHCSKIVTYVLYLFLWLHVRNMLFLIAFVAQGWRSCAGGWMWSSHRGPCRV